MPTPIPVRLTLAESTAAALAEAADDLAQAQDAQAFLAALDSNHRLWLTLSDIAVESWGMDRHLADFVISASRTAGRGLTDDRLETLVAINREMSRRLASGRAVDPIRKRAALAWSERKPAAGQRLKTWLIDEIQRQARLQ